MLDRAMPTLEDLRHFARYHLVRRVHDHPARETELDVVPLDYDPDVFARTLASFSDRFDIEELAARSYRGRTLPTFRIDTRHARPARRRLLVLSGVHGNERAGIVCVPEILERLDAERERLADVAVRILTPVNPVGAAELSRFNAEGYDVNRDFVLFLTPEARLVRDAYASFRPDFVSSLHEGPQDATFMFANRHVDAGLASRLLAALEAGGTALAERDYFGLRLRPRGLSASTPLQRAIVGLWSAALSMRTSIDYAARLGIPEITLESSWKSPDRAARVRAHVDLVLALARELAASV